MFIIMGGILYIITQAFGYNVARNNNIDPVLLGWVLFFSIILGVYATS